MMIYKVITHLLINNASNSDFINKIFYYLLFI